MFAFAGTDYTRKHFISQASLESLTDHLSLCVNSREYKLGSIENYRVFCDLSGSNKKQFYIPAAPILMVLFILKHPLDLLLFNI